MSIQAINFLQTFLDSLHYEGDIYWTDYQDMASVNDTVKGCLQSFGLVVQPNI